MTRRGIGVVLAPLALAACANDVPGASAEQLQWRIETIEVKTAS